MRGAVRGRPDGANAHDDPQADDQLHYVGLAAAEQALRSSLLAEHRGLLPRTQRRKQQQFATRSLPYSRPFAATQMECHCFNMSTNGPVFPPPPPSPQDPHWQQPVNDLHLIHSINSNASLPWTAAPFAPFEGLTHGDARSRLGTLPRRALDLPLRTPPEAITGLPKSFDARDEWPHCPSIGTVRNEGQCGSCWAQSAVEVLEDRFCIAGSPVAPDACVNKVQYDDVHYRYSRGTIGCLSPGYMVACDSGEDPSDSLGGCNGGLVDEAWSFLMERGVPKEECVPYQHCDNPFVYNCSLPTATIPDDARYSCNRTNEDHPQCVLDPDGQWLGASCINVTGQQQCLPPPPPPPGPPPPPPGPTPPPFPDQPPQPPYPPPPPPSGRGGDQCPQKCDGADGAEIEESQLFKAKSGYVVAQAGDVEAIQLEIAKNGPVQAVLAVYSDFTAYKTGVYERSDLAKGPSGE